MTREDASERGLWDARQGRPSAADESPHCWGGELRAAYLDGYQSGVAEKRVSARNPSGHYCQDETATVVNGKWICNCPGVRS